MSLSEIKNKLYKKEADKNLYQHAESEFDARSPMSGSKKLSSDKEEKWEDASETYRKRKEKLKKIAIIGGSIVFLIILSAVFYKIKQATFDAGRVVLAIQGMDEIKSGKLVAYEINYKNNNWVGLKNVSLRLTYPENFQPEENPNFVEESPTTGVYHLENIKRKGDGKIIFNARTYSSSENLTYLKAELVYTPSFLSGEQNSKTQYGITLTTAPISLEIMAPQKVANGDAIEYAVNYKNNGTEDFEMLRIKMDYPDGFSYSRSNPLVSEGDNVWYIGRLSPGQEGRVIIKGKLEGQDSEIKKARAYVGIINEGIFLNYTDASTETQVAYPSLVIAQVVNGSSNLNINAGDTLNYEIGFGNNSSSTLKDLIVTEEIDSTILDYSTLSLEKGGYFNNDRKTITWKPADNSKLASLEPGEVGTIKFSIRVKDVIPINSALDKNFIFSSLAKIDSTDIDSPLRENQIISGNQIDMKLNTKLVLEVRGMYNSDTISNSGPIPPVIGQNTTYTISWLATNVSNDVADAKITAVLPTNVTATGLYAPEGIDLSFNERNNEITWNIGDMPSGTGIISQPKEAVFQVALAPLPSQVNSEAQLVGETTFTARDLFTGQELSKIFKAKTTYLVEDSSISGYKVQASE